jgi:hypothetical protein
MDKVDYKISYFRSKYEQDLRKLVTQGCCVASCTNDGMAEQEEIEMNEFTKLVVSLVDRAKKTRKPPAAPAAPACGVSVLRPRG